MELYLKRENQNTAAAIAEERQQWQDKYNSAEVQAARRECEEEAAKRSRYYKALEPSKRTAAETINALFETEQQTANALCNVYLSMMREDQWRIGRICPEDDSSAKVERLGEMILAQGLDKALRLGQQGLKRPAKHQRALAEFQQTSEDCIPPPQAVISADGEIKMRPPGSDESARRSALMSQCDVSEEEVEQTVTKCQASIDERKRELVESELPIRERRSRCVNY